jgi:hypothetical protein
VWTWNAIGKGRGAWRLAPDADESRKGFLLNHVIASELPDPRGGGRVMSNSDPVTGQAGWYDVRVRIRPAEAGEPAETFPQVPQMHAVPGVGAARRVLAYFAGRRAS